MNPNDDNCQVCNSHLYSLYAGGAKERVENTYYCNGCQKVIELDHAIPRNTINEINIDTLEEGIYFLYLVDKDSNADITKKIIIER